MCVWKKGYELFYYLLLHECICVHKHSVTMLETTCSSRWMWCVFQHYSRPSLFLLLMRTGEKKERCRKKEIQNTVGAAVSQRCFQTKACRGMPSTNFIHTSSFPSAIFHLLTQPPLNCLSKVQCCRPARLNWPLKVTEEAKTILFSRRAALQRLNLLITSDIHSEGLCHTN